MCLPVKAYRTESEFEHAGLKCAVVQNREAGHRCGYVRVPPNHPSHGKGYDDVNVEVHGGLTFAEPEPCTHEDGQGWWFGFDCAHYGDEMYDPQVKPEDCSKRTAAGIRIHRQFMSPDEHYWTREEVEAEARHLAEQLVSTSTTP